MGGAAGLCLLRRHRHDQADPQRRQRLFIKAPRALGIRDRETNMVEHGLSSFGRTGLSHFAMSFDIHIVGGGLAGSEAAWQLAEAGLRVRLSEMRGGGNTTPAHETDRFAEMVCSNSFRSDDADHHAVGLLHQEMRALGSLVMRAADQHRVPAGSALAVDRDGFAAEVTRTIDGHPNIMVVRERVDILSDHPTIIATGPLTG